MGIAQFSADPFTFACALGNLTGLSSQAFAVEGVIASARYQRHSLLSSGIIISYYITIPAEAYGYSGAYEAYLALNKSLHHVVENGEFTALVNLMSRAPKFSRAYRKPVYSNTVVVDPFLFSRAPATFHPTNVSNAISDSSPASSSAVRQSVVADIAIAIAILVFCFSLAFHVDWMYFSAERRKQRERAKKDQEYKEGVIPESDAILWLGSEPFETVGNARIHGNLGRCSVSSSHSYDSSTDVSLMQSNRSVEDTISTFDERRSISASIPNHDLSGAEEEELIYG